MPKLMVGGPVGDAGISWKTHGPIDHQFGLWARAWAHQSGGARRRGCGRGRNLAPAPTPL